MRIKGIRKAVSKWKGLRELGMTGGYCLVYYKKKKEVVCVKDDYERTSEAVQIQYNVIDNYGTINEKNVKEYIELCY